MKFGKIRDAGTRTTYYGVIQEDGALREFFATNPMCVGVSEMKAQTLHEGPAVEISQREYNAAWLFQMEDEISEADASASIAELRARYPEPVDA